MAEMIQFVDYLNNKIQIIPREWSKIVININYYFSITCTFSLKNYLSHITINFIVITSLSSGNAQLLLHNISVCRHISVLHLQLFAALSLPPMPLHDSQQPLSNWLGNTHRSLTGLLACVTESFDPFVAFTKSFSIIFLVSVVRISEKIHFSPRQDVPELNLSLYFSCANLKINVK